MIWQMMVALLHSNGQLRTERDGDTEKGCQKPAVQQKTTDDDDDGDIPVIELRSILKENTIMQKN